MRICFLNFNGTPTLEATDKMTGGLNISAFYLPRTITQLSPKTEVCLIWRDDGRKNKYFSLLREKGIKLVKIKAGPRKRLSRKRLEQALKKFVRKVGLYFQKHHFDIIQTSGSEAGLTMLLIRKKGVCNSSVWIQKNFATLAVRKVVNEGMPKSKIDKGKVTKREKSVLSQCDYILSSTLTDKWETSKVFDINKDKISVMSQGLSHNIFHPPRILVKRLPLVITAGRMSKIKDYPFLLRAFRKVIDMNSDIRNLLLLIIGGNEKERNDLGLRKIVDTLGLRSQVCFKDGVPHSSLARYFRLSRVVVGSSKHETFGRIPIEARACGTPFVVRNNSSYRDTARQGEGGYFTENNSEEKMANKISEILNLSFRKWRKLSVLATRSTRQFSWRRSALDHLRLYNNLIKKSDIIF